MNIHTPSIKLNPGDKVRLLSFKTGDLEYQRQLLAIGLVPNCEFLVVRVAPLGDPIQIRIRNTSICLRQHELAYLEIEKIGPVEC